MLLLQGCHTELFEGSVKSGFRVNNIGLQIDKSAF